MTDRLAAMQAFVRLVEVRSFSAVARELRIRQSTVSKWLAALEAELGVQLIDRTTRSQRVTQPGERFYDRCKDILAAYEHATGELQAQRPNVTGRLRASVPVVFGRMFVVPHIPRLLRRHADLELELGFNDRYINLVEEGFDVAIRVGLPADSSLRSRKLGDSRRHVVASPRYLRTMAAISRPQDLADHRCLVHTGLNTATTWVFNKGGRSIRAQVRGRCAANNSEALLGLARSGMGIALLASWLVCDDLRSGRLVSLLPDYELPRAPIHALMTPGRYIHPRVRVFLDHLQHVYAKLGRRGYFEAPVVE